MGMIFVLNGPNLNLLGTREPDIYGSATLDDVGRMLSGRARELGVEIDMRQSNHEGHLVDWIHEAAADGAAAIILNAGAYSHTSVAIRDAVASVSIPVIEVHVSNVYAREDFRRVNLIAPVARGSIIGLGVAGYVLALDAAARLCKGAGTPADAATNQQ